MVAKKIENGREWRMSCKEINIDREVLLMVSREKIVVEVLSDVETALRLIRLKGIEAICHLEKNGVKHYEMWLCLSDCVMMANVTGSIRVSMTFTPFIQFIQSE